MPLRPALDAPGIFDNPMRPVKECDYTLPFRFPVQDAYPPQVTFHLPTGAMTGRRFYFFLFGVLPFGSLTLSANPDLLDTLIEDSVETTRQALFLCALVVGLFLLIRQANPVQQPVSEGSLQGFIRYAALLAWPVALAVTILAPGFATVCGLTATLLFLHAFRKHFFEIATAGLWSPAERDAFLNSARAPHGIQPASLRTTFKQAWSTWATYNDRELKCPTLVSSPIGNLWTRYVLTAYSAFFFGHAVSYFVIGNQTAHSTWLQFAVGAAPALNACLAFIPSAVLAAIAMALALGLIALSLIGAGQVACSMQFEAFAPDRWDRMLPHVLWDNEIDL